MKFYYFCILSTVMIGACSEGQVPATPSNSRAVVGNCPRSITWEQAKTWGDGGSIGIGDVTWAAYSGTDYKGNETLGTKGFNAQRLSTVVGAAKALPQLTKGRSQQVDAGTELLCTYSYTLISLQRTYGLTISGTVDSEVSPVIDPELVTPPDTLQLAIDALQALSPQAGGYSALKAALAKNPSLHTQVDQLAEAYAAAQAKNYCDLTSNADVSRTVGKLISSMSAAQENSARQELIALGQDFITQKAKCSNPGATQF